MNIYPWQDSQWQQLCRVYTNKRLPHAILLNGSAGLGKFDFAKEFAKFVLCSDAKKLSTLQACDVCKSCKLINTDAHPDFHLIVLEDANVIKIEQIKNLITDMNHKAHYNGFKIAIIYPAEKMNINAANALLKNLEEPVGSDTLFLLISDQLMQLPATIRSRCQRINFNVPSITIIKEWLTSQSIATDNEVFDAAYQLAEGVPLLLRQYLEAPESTDTKNLMLLLQTVINDKTMLISAASKQLVKFSLTDFFHCLQVIMSNLIKNTATLNKEKLHILLDDVNQRKKAIEKGIQLNAQLVIEEYLIKLKNREAT